MFVAVVSTVHIARANDDGKEKRCNGAAALCERRYDEVAYVTTHNAMSNRAAGWLGPNQNFGIARQLEDGVRGLMLDVHDHEGSPYLAHGSVQFGKLPLVDGLREVRRFLDHERSEVVTIIFESYVDAEATRGRI